MIILSKIALLLSIIFSINFTYSLANYNENENINKMKYVIGNVNLIDSLLNSSFFRTKSKPDFQKNDFQKKLLIASDNSLQSYKKAIKINDSLEINLEIISFVSKEKKDTSYFFFYKNTSFPWKLISKISKSAFLNDTNKIFKYFDAYSKVILLLNDDRFIKKHLKLLINILHLKNEDISFQNIKRKLLDFYLWEDIYIDQNQSRRICFFVNYYGDLRYYIQIELYLDENEIWRPIGISILNQ